MKKVIGIFLILVGFSVVFPGSDNKTIDYLIGGAEKVSASSGGPIVLDGMDPVCHASYGENTYQYIAKVLKSVYDQSTMPGNTGKVAILGVSSPTSAGGCGGNWTTLLNTKFSAQFTSIPTFEFITTAAQLDAFFNVPAPTGSTTTTIVGSSNISSIPPRMIWIPDDWGRSSTINAKLTANAEKIADFVNSGGGIFANYNSYGWLTALLPSATFNNGGCNGGPEATSVGTADFGLTNTMVAACWHGYFTGNVGTLKTLVDYPYPTSSDTRKAVSIGGGSVSLPSSFTLSISPQNPEAGQDLIVTATAKTISGVAQPNVAVTVTVSAGPDAGLTFTALTNSLGIATITIRTNSVGTAVYTATATVNDIAKTVSATVTWIPAATTTSTSTTVAPTTVAPTTIATTTIAPTTIAETTIATTTTTVPEIVTTTVAAVVNESIVTTTTVHDHSSHSHVELPKTGSNFYWLYGILMIAFGSFLVMNSRKSHRQ